MKKILVLLVALSLATGCLIPAAVAEEKSVTVVTTIFPIYDWCREIIGGSPNVELILLLDSGVDLHSYQPTAQDILRISTADLFICVGGESDEWVEDVLATAMNPDLRALSLVEAMGADIKIEEIVEGMEHDHDHVHDHEDEDHDHEDEDHDHEDHEHEEHEEETDEHVWLSLRSARKLVSVISGILCETDPANTAAYRANAAAYDEKLAALDARYAETVRNAAHSTFLFGDRFPFRYLADDYGLSYYAAFTGCSAETEASFQTILFLAQKVDELGLPAVLTIENAHHRIAQTVVAATSARDQRILSMNSMQGTTAGDVRNGVTYLSVMEENLAVLADALN